MTRNHFILEPPYTHNENQNLVEPAEAVVVVDPAVDEVVVDLVVVVEDAAKH